MKLDEKGLVEYFICPMIINRWYKHRKNVISN